MNSRPIFGRVQEDRPRFASFVATTNNRHPLKDATGSRRYICILIPDGQLIDNTGDIDYGQLYAQVVYELRELKAPYWYNNDEVARIQQLNQDYIVRDSDHLSRPPPPLNKGIPKDCVRDEHILLEATLLHQSVEVPDFSVEPPHFIYVGSIFTKKTKNIWLFQEK